MTQIKRLFSVILYFNGFWFVCVGVAYEFIYIYLLWIYSLWYVLQCLFNSAKKIYWIFAIPCAHSVLRCTITFSSNTPPAQLEHSYSTAQRSDAAVKAPEGVVAFIN